jgi:hypothetical protein
MARRLHPFQNDKELQKQLTSAAFASSPGELGIKPLLGWREWVQLPELDLSFFESKIDTGARSSSLDAKPIQEFQRQKQRWLRFSVFAGADLSMSGQTVEARLVGFRDVRSSTGHLTHRPVILTAVQIGADRWPIELTLTNRRQMGFRLLLGRSAIENRFHVDASRSFLAGPRSECHRYP